MKTTILPLLLLPALASAQATISLGVRGGANRALTTTDPAGTQLSSSPYRFATSKSALTAWQVGAVAEVRLGQWALQPALLFSQKGERLGYNFSSIGYASAYGYELASTIRTNWLELPLNVVYTLHGDHGLQLLAGPYLALGVGGRERGSYNYYNSYAFPAGPASLDEPMAYGARTTNRRLDVGLNFGLGYRQGPVQLQLSYGLGLRNLHMSDPLNYAVGGPSVHDFRADAAYSRVAQLTGTYFFRL